MTHFTFSIFVPKFRRPGLFMSYICDLFFIFSLIFIAIYHITSLKQTHLFLYIFKNISFYVWMKKANNFQITKVQPKGAA